MCARQGTRFQRLAVSSSHFNAILSESDKLMKKFRKTSVSRCYRDVNECRIQQRVRSYEKSFFIMTTI